MSCTLGVEKVKKKKEVPLLGKVPISACRLRQNLNIRNVLIFEANGVEFISKNPNKKVTSISEIGNQSRSCTKG